MNINDYKLKENPFRTTPANRSEDIVWAGFPDLKEKFEKRIQRSIQLQNSTLVLNWGEYGSGKTHAARFFSTARELNRIKNELNAESSLPLSFVFSLPKSKKPIYDIFISVIDRLDISQIRTTFSELEDEISNYIDSFENNRHIAEVTKAVFNNDIDIQILLKYFYGNVSSKELELLSNYGILRKLLNDNDYILLLSSLFSSLTYEKKKYSCIIIWFDEFEDVSILSNSNIDDINNFVREILDYTSNNLLIFLNITQSATFNASDLSAYVYESVKSRIKERINFELPSIDDFKLYLEDILKQYRQEEHSNTTNIFFPFDEATINSLFNDTRHMSLRMFNEYLSILLELAILEKQKEISLDFYNREKAEIIGWKED